MKAARSAIIQSLVILFGTWLLAGCGLLGWQDYRDGVPSSESLNIKVPGDNTASVSNPLQLEYSVAPMASQTGQYGQLYIATVQMTRAVNTGVLGILTILDGVLAYPPTSVSGDEAIWGPFTPGGLSAVEVRMTVKHESGEKFSYTMETRKRAGGDYKTILSGTNERHGATARRGVGNFLIDFDAAAANDPAVVERGQAKADYDTITDGRRIDVYFLNFQGRGDPERKDSTYNFHENPDLSGNFIFATTGDIHQSAGMNFPAKETYLANTRWRADGAGRCDVNVYGGDMDASGLQKVVVSECWGTDFFVTFYTEDFTDKNGNTFSSKNRQGDDKTCVYPTAEPPKQP